MYVMGKGEIVNNLDPFESLLYSIIDGNLGINHFLTSSMIRWKDTKLAD
jgi:hypothetical protein